MNRFLKSTTAIVSAISLALPLPVLAADEAHSGPTDAQIRKLNLDPNMSSDRDSNTQDEEQADAAKAARKAERKAERQQERRDERKAQRQAEQSGQPLPDANTEDPLANEKAAMQEARKAERKAQRQAEQAGQPLPDANTEDPLANERAAMEEAQRADRKAQRQAERRAAREAARAQGNVLPPDAQAQADTAAELDAQRNEAVNGQGTPRVVRERVEPGGVRRADQEFTPAPVAEQKSGLSNVEKVALLGLGAFAVGQLLKNGDKVVSNSGDRVVVEGSDGYRVLKNDDSLLRQPGSDLRTETYSDGSTRSYVTNPDGSQVVTVRAADGRVLRRTRILPGGQEVRLFDDTQAYQPVQVAQLPQVSRDTVYYNDSVSASDLQAAMMATGGNPYGRSFSLAQVRSIDGVRKLVPEISVENLRFETGSAAIRPDQARELASLGSAIRGAIQANPGEVFLIEGHTDATGSAEMNLALSDRRAETVALALTQYFQVPPENLVVQGYGEADLKVPTYSAEELNRRVAVRRITPLLN